MTVRISLTLEQISDIFNAGCNRGSEEEACFQAGARVPERRSSAFATAVWGVINEEQIWGDEDFVSIETVESWVEKIKI